MKINLTKHPFRVFLLAVILLIFNIVTVFANEDREVVRNGGVVSSASEYSSQIGVDILKKGGNAVDAAVAAIFAIGVVEPNLSSIGGSGIMTIYTKENDQCIVIEYMETVPLNMTAGWFDPDTDKNTAKNAAVPGQVYGILTALDQYGTMSREEVMAPAIELARNGFRADKRLADSIGKNYEILVQNPDFANVYLNNGKLIKEGDIIKNELLANTLQKIAEQGIDGFYNGELARNIVNGLQAENNLITLNDMSNYRSIEREPIQTSYHGYNIIVPSMPSNGGEWLLESLNILENYDLKSMGVHSSEYLFTLNEALRLGMADAFTFLGDPAFYDIPVDTIISKDYAKKRLENMPADKAMINPPHGDLKSNPQKSSREDSKETSHISVMDQFGNVVSTTNTIGNAWGCKYMAPGLGFFYNSHISNLEHDPQKSDSPDYVIPGKRVRSTITPAIVSKDGEPIMAIGSPGSSSIPPAILTVLNNVLIFDMDIQQAIDMPRAFVLDLYNPILTIEGSYFSLTVKNELLSLGYEFNDVSTYNSALGGIAAVFYDTKTQKYNGGADPRRNYKSISYEDESKEISENKELQPAA
ncbi:gamma-glutamyltransferase [Clostridium sp. Marseille-P2415]|uniref:gamma-glutamyltransferase n=1 Tax=Clostridium sp. Marseille-P2415 TaxID=1805471 RepID=UPI00135658EC|nr:gamma-glutamyltransferase [Clostridium sp. Marseille-P2415]